jgi:hypothetical protein
MVRSRTFKNFSLPQKFIKKNARHKNIFYRFFEPEKKIKKMRKNRIDKLQDNEKYLLLN